jgi:hypothetical protein
VEAVRPGAQAVVAAPVVLALPLQVLLVPEELKEAAQEEALAPVAPAAVRPVVVPAED